MDRNAGVTARGGASLAGDRSQAASRQENAGSMSRPVRIELVNDLKVVFVVEVDAGEYAVFVADLENGHRNHQGASELEGVVLSEKEIVRHRGRLRGAGQFPLDGSFEGLRPVAITVKASAVAAARSRSRPRSGLIVEDPDSAQDAIPKSGIGLLHLQPLPSNDRFRRDLHRLPRTESGQGTASARMGKATVPMPTEHRDDSTGVSPLVRYRDDSAAALLRRFARPQRGPFLHGEKYEQLRR